MGLQEHLNELHLDKDVDQRKRDRGVHQVNSLWV